MKKRFAFLSTVMILYLIIPLLSFNPTTISSEPSSVSVISAEVFSDDFNDGNIDDWVIWGVNVSGQLWPGSFSVDDGSLRSNGTQNSCASHLCTMTTGTWSFDVDCVSSVNHFYIAFFAEEFDNETSLIPYEYGIMVVTGVFDVFDSEFVLYRRDQGNINLNAILGRYNLAEVTGWHHIDITRDSDGRFYAYFNGTLGISGADTTYSSADAFTFYSWTDGAIDNVYVSDSIDIDQVGPFLDNPGTQEIEENEAFYLDLDATDYSGISQWWLNDSVHFSIDANGVISNAAILAPGDYGLEVSVNDTLDYTTTVEFTVSVSSSNVGTGFDTMTLALIAGGVIALVVIVVLVIKVKKQ